MTHKTKSETSTVTVQLGLDVALGDGATQKPELHLLDLDQLTGTIETPDSKYTAELWPMFVESCRTGLEEGIKVRPNPEMTHPDGRPTYEVRDGRHRVLAYKLLRMKQIPATVRIDWGNDAQAALGEFKLNNMRVDPTPYEQALGFQRALASKKVGGAGLSIAEVAKMVGVSESLVRSRLALVAAGFPEHVARRIGVDLSHDCAEPYQQLAGHPDLLAAVAEVKIPPRQSAWQVRQAIMEQLQKKKLLFPIALTNEQRQAVGGYENKTYEKRTTALPLVIIGNESYTTDGAKLREILDDEAQKWRTQNQKDAAAAKTTKDGKTRGPTVDARARIRLPDAQRGLAAKRVKGLVAWSDGLQCALAQTFLREYFHASTHIEADEAALAEALGIDAKEVSPLRLTLTDTEKFKAYWKQERAQADKLLAWTLFACNRTTEHVQYGAATKSCLILGDDAWCRLLTGKSERDTFAALKDQVRAESDGRDKKSTKLDKASRKAAEEAGATRIRKRLARAPKTTAPDDDSDGGEEPEAAIDDAAAADSLLEEQEA